jgi:hypothetical protein
MSLHALERRVLGIDPDAAMHYRLRGASPAEMLSAALASNYGDEIIVGGLQHVADELEIFALMLEMHEGDETDRFVLDNALRGIEARVRVIGEIARRIDLGLRTATLTVEKSIAEDDRKSLRGS